jgi:Zn-dependent peptidase ImmA (M78 family)
MSTTITRLRDLMPLRPLTIIESLRIAELQATRLLELSGVTAPQVPETVITKLPRVQVERISPSPVAGATEWSHGRWLILLNGSDVTGRQRFSLAHEFKHVIDARFLKVVYPPRGGLSSKQQAEPICDHFAACLLMPRAWVKKLWGQRVQNVAQLADLFGVSRQAMQVRLMQIGLIERPARCQVTV